jgi:hypothetical protein
MFCVILVFVKTTAQSTGYSYYLKLDGKWVPNTMQKNKSDSARTRVK